MSYISEPCPCPTCGAQIDRLDPVLVENKELRTVVRDLLWAIGHDNDQILNETTARAKAFLEPKPDLRALLPELAVIRQVMKEPKP